MFSCKPFEEEYSADDLSKNQTSKQDSKIQEKEEVKDILVDNNDLMEMSQDNAEIGKLSSVSKSKSQKVLTSESGINIESISQKSSQMKQNLPQQTSL